MGHLIPCGIRTKCLLACGLLMTGLGADPTASANEPLRVDLNPDQDRSDVLSRHAANWRITEAAEITRDFGDVNFTFRKTGDVGNRLTWGWWKAGFDSGAVLASDGLTIRDGQRGGRIEMTIRGLTPGKHSIVTWHNGWEPGKLSPCHVAVDGQVRVRGVQPSARVLHDDDAATAFIEVTAQKDREVVVTFTPDGTGDIDNVVINGFAIDVLDPARQARKPSPAHDDEHVPEPVVLKWTPSPRAKAHRLYFGSNQAVVAAATTSSPEYRGELAEPHWNVVPAQLRSSDSAQKSEARPTNNTRLDPFANYFWRVDEVDRDNPRQVTRGEVWRFKVRRLAFPDAEGYGRFAAGGRGGRVMEVTNLNDAGPGSLREAVESSGPRTVVFRVGGTIPLASKLVVRHPYLTVAGQTAPGDGICVRGFTFGCLGTHDVILRHLRIRVGDEAHQTMDGTGFASTNHAIMDHCSVSWSIDEGVSSRGAGHITVQRCLISEALNIADHKKYQPGKGHSFAGSISGDVGSFHHNLIAHCAGRNWSLAGGLNRGGQFAGRLDIRNNVVFNWEHRTTDGGVKALNFVNNVYLPGPATRVFHLVKPDAGSPHDPQQYFIAGNRMIGRKEYDADNWQNGGVIVDPKWIQQIKLEQPFCESHVETHRAEDVLENVLADVGANWPQHDAVDMRAIHDVRQRSATAKGSRGGLPGIIDSQADVGGWPALRSGVALEDSDHDGMPDVWEHAQGLNPHNAADANLITGGDGYTNLERYLNGIVVRRRES